MIKSKDKLMKFSKKMYVGYKVSSRDIRNIKEVIDTLEDEKEEVLNEFIEEIKSYTKRKYKNYDKLEHIDKTAIAEILGYSVSTVYNKMKTKTFSELEIKKVLDSV